MKKILYLLLLSLAIIACKKDEIIPETPPAPKKYQIAGKAEKGPFLKGSKITIQELSNDLTPTGKNFTTTIIDDEGTFNLGNFELASPYVELIADGFFYNEITGDLSKSQITLYGLADLQESTTVNVNLITHITKDRIVHLVKTEKTTFKDAQLKAQKELLTIFGLQKYNEKNFNNISISDGSYESSSQVIISSILLKDKSEAQFTEFITTLSSNFKSTGTFPDNIKEDLWKISVQLPFENIASQLANRYQQLNKEINLLDLRYFVDWDKDGIAGNELGDINAEKILEFEVDTLFVPKSGGEFKVKINANIPFSGNYPSFSPIPGVSIDYNPIREIYTNIMIIDKNLIGNEIIIKIAASDGAFMNDSDISVYSYDGKTKATLVIKQEGDLSKLSNKQIQVFSPFITASYDAFDLNFTTEALYTQSVHLPADGYFNQNWEQFYENKINSSSSVLGSIWSGNYQAIGRLNILITYNELPGSLKSSFLTLRSILYYQTTILWGNIVYIENNDPNNIYIPQSKENEVYEKLSSVLEKERNLLSDEKQTVLPFSRDLANATLAKILMHQKKHSEALELLEIIINSNKYQLESSREKALQKNSNELIYYTLLPENSNYKKVFSNKEILPMSRFTEILLLSSECAFHTGNKTKMANYLNQIEKARGRASLYSSTSTIENIRELWRDEMAGEFSYFDFLKRNGLTETTLNIESYRRLFPIPRIEIDRNPVIIQNPGY